MQDWLVHLVGSGWVYLALYAFVMIDGFFPPIPSESAVIALAALSESTGSPNLYLVAGVSALGAFSGDQIAYTIGTRIDVHKIRLFRTERGRRSLDWAERALAQRGAAFILAARYIPVGRVAVNMTAGALGYPRRRFVGLTALAAVTWAVYATAIGLGAGRWLHDHPVLAVVVGVAVGLLVGLLIDQVLRRFTRVGEVQLRTAEDAAGTGGSPDGEQQPGGPHRTDPDPDERT
ncbi:DedA family protein [Cellulomonas sp. P22]|uniref:DedA family protein n=1 Tax=Cellulomonas sp. P22 TaxID=3373189 RepID=UPI0037886048